MPALPRLAGPFAGRGRGVAIACLLVLPGLGLGSGLFACSHADASLPYPITSLAVLPGATVPPGDGSGRLAAQAVAVELDRMRSFRVIQPEGVRRLLAGPEGLEWLQRAQDRAFFGEGLASETSRALGARLAVNGLALAMLSVRMRDQVEGEVSLGVAVYDVASGQLAWRGSSNHAFRGMRGDAAFLRLLTRMARTVMSGMPGPHRLEREAP